MSKTYKTLILGASYGSLLGSKMLLAGHDVTLICTAGTAALINAEGTEVRLPIRGRDGLVSVHSKASPIEGQGQLSAATPEQVNPADFDLVVFGMQEPQYGSAGVRELLESIAKVRVPCMAIMNMPPLPYLARLPGIDAAKLHECFTEPDVWQHFDPELVTLASPDPQAFRPPEEGKNILQVSLPTNFKVARFADDAHTDMLKTLEADIESIDFPLPEGGSSALPVKLKVFDSLYVPLAKWSMLITGNYRCIQADDMRSIRDAVHSDLEESKAVYQWVVDLCVSMGADPADLVPFEKYAKAAEGLVKPSSGARALFGGAPNIERVDRLVQLIARQQGQSLPVLDTTVELVDARLTLNRAT